MLALPAAASAQGGTVVVSEVQTGGSQPEQEFVELVNRSVTSVDVSGWSVRRLSAGCSVQTAGALAQGTVLRPGQHYLIASSSLGSATGQASANGGPDAFFSDDTDRLDAGAGAVELLDASAARADAVAYGDTGLACSENLQTLPPPPGGSSERFGGSQDTDDNRVDFLTRNISDPDDTTRVDDRDGDGARDDTDNCIATSNASQADTDGDGAGDACDASTAFAPSAPGGSPTAGDPGPAEILVLRLEPAQPRLGETATLVVRARDPLAALLGVSVDFGEPTGQFGEMACQRPPFSAEFDLGRASTFRVETGSRRCSARPASTRSWSRSSRAVAAASRASPGGCSR